MAQYDVHRVKGGRLVLDCQSDLLSHLKTRLVVQLFPESDGIKAIRHLNPVLTIAGKPYVLIAQTAATLHTRDLGEVIGSAAEHSEQVTRAFDVLLSGI